MGGQSHVLPDSPLSLSLARGRDVLNARVAQYRKNGSPFDGAVFAQVLTETLPPVIAAVARAAPEQQDQVTLAMFDLTLELVGRELLGPRTHFPPGERVFSQLLPGIPHLLAKSPHEVAASLFNASHGVWQQLGDRVDLWQNEMARLSPYCTSIAELWALGSIVAWRSGLAHAREAALAAWETLSDSLAGLCLGWAPGLSRAVVRQHYSDPFCVPALPGTPARLVLLTTVGGFRGFGGVFLRPPEVWVSGKHLLAGDRERVYTIHADCFGCTLWPAPHAEPPGDSGTPVTVDALGTVHFQGLVAEFPMLAGHGSCVAIDHLVAVSFPRSHRVALVARVGQGP